MADLNYPAQTDKDILQKSIVAMHIEMIQATSQLQSALSFTTSNAYEIYGLLKTAHGIFCALHGFARTKVQDKLSKEDKEAVEEFRLLEFNKLLSSDPSKPYAGSLKRPENTNMIIGVSQSFLILFDRYQDAMQKAGIGGL